MVAASARAVKTIDVCGSSLDGFRVTRKASVESDSNVLQGDDGNSNGSWSNRANVRALAPPLTRGGWEGFVVFEERKHGGLTPLIPPLSGGRWVRSRTGMDGMATRCPVMQFPRRESRVLCSCPYFLGSIGILHRRANANRPYAGRSATRSS